MPIPIPICTYAVDADPMVSAYVQRGLYWEPDRVASVVAMLRRLSEAAALTAVTSSEMQTTAEVGFVDLGANIGAYSLAAAHSGYRVGGVYGVVV